MNKFFKCSGSSWGKLLLSHLYKFFAKRTRVITSFPEFVPCQLATFTAKKGENGICNSYYSSWWTVKRFEFIDICFCYSLESLRSNRIQTLSIGLNHLHFNFLDFCDLSGDWFLFLRTKFCGLNILILERHDLLWGAGVHIFVCWGAVINSDNPFTKRCCG